MLGNKSVLMCRIYRLIYLDRTTRDWQENVRWKTYGVRSSRSVRANERSEFVNPGWWSMRFPFACDSSWFFKHHEQRLPIVWPNRKRISIGKKDEKKKQLGWLEKEEKDMSRMIIFVWLLLPRDRVKRQLKMSLTDNRSFALLCHEKREQWKD